MGKVTYLGIDETTLGIGCNSSLVVAAETSDERLTEDLGYRALRKSRNYVELNEPMPSIDSLPGLSMFHWTRAKGGRFSRAIVQHAAIAQVVLANGYKPESTVLLIDRFHCKDAESVFLLKEFLHARKFKIPERHIQICGEGDRSVPIINYADLISFQIGLELNERYEEFRSPKREFMHRPYRVAFDERRVWMPTGRENNDLRDTLEQVLRGYKSRREFRQYLASLSVA